MAASPVGLGGGDSAWGDGGALLWQGYPSWAELRFFFFFLEVSLASFHCVLLCCRC